MQNVLRTLKVLEVVAASEPARLGEIAGQLRLPKTTVQRALRTLEPAEWITKADTDVTRWVIARGPRLLLGIRPAETITAAALPHMRAVRDLTGETVHLAVAGPSHSRMIVERAEGTREVRSMVPVGTLYPDALSAAGIAVLALAPDASVDAAISSAREGGLLLDEAPTRHAVTRAREDGYAVWTGSGGEVVGVSSAILINQRPAATISVLIPTSRYREADRATLGQMVVDAANRSSVGSAAPFG